MTTMQARGLPATVPEALEMTAGHIETHGLMCGEWQSVTNLKKGCAIGTLRIVCGLPAQWDGFDSTGEQAKERRKCPKRHKLFMAAMDTLIAYLGFEHESSNGYAYDGAPEVISWADSHANGDNGIDQTPESVVKAFREAARLARAYPEQYTP